MAEKLPEGVERFCIDGKSYCFTPAYRLNDLPTILALAKEMEFEMGEILQIGGHGDAGYIGLTRKSDKARSLITSKLTSGGVEYTLYEPILEVVQT